LTRPGPERKEFLGGVKVDTIHHLVHNPINIDCMNCVAGGTHVVRIGILSDTHDQVRRTGRAVAALKSAGAEALFHCGDITIAEVVHECHGIPAYFVFGNCDFDRQALREAIDAIGGSCLERGGVVPLAGRKIAVTHGDCDEELRRLRALKPDLLLSGHTHRFSDTSQGSIRQINPGALHRASAWTVALLDLASGRLDLLPIRDGHIHD
jgi:putative phosphoesterase